MTAEQRATFVRPLLSAAALVIVIVMAFGFVVGAVKGTLQNAFKAERAIGEAQRYADFAIGRQLDEQNGLRGYVASRRRAFLEPYEKASREIDATFDALNLALVRAGLGEERPFVDRARALNRRWQRQVAKPLLARPRHSEGAILEVRGKTLVDRYRATIAHVDRAIVARGALDTTAATLAVSRVGLLGVLAVALVAAVLLYSLRTQSRLSRELLVERQVAAAMQRGLLQSSLPTVADVAFDASYVPAGREALVGGDWYDINILPDGRVMFSIGDVAGHGIDAAIVMSRAREAIIALGYDGGDPALVLARANDVLVLQGSQMATALFGYVELSKRTVVYASAGHPPPLLATIGQPTRFLPHGGLPLGIFSNVTYTNERFVAPARSAFVLYTDGFTERTFDLLAGERAMKVAIDQLIRSGFDRLATRTHETIFGQAAPNDDAAIVSISFLAAEAVDASDELDGPGLISSLAPAREA